MNNPKYKEIRAAYSFYNVHTETPLTQIMNDALILAKQDSFDVFNCLNIMTNASFVDELKFGVGDGNLHYYFYNFMCPKMSHEQVRHIRSYNVFFCVFTLGNAWVSLLCQIVLNRGKFADDIWEHFFYVHRICKEENCKVLSFFRYWFEWNQIFSRLTAIFPVVFLLFTEL